MLYEDWLVVGQELVNVLPDLRRAVDEDVRKPEGSSKQSATCGSRFRLAYFRRSFVVEI